jgi:hypothetical protein
MHMHHGLAGDAAGGTARSVHGSELNRDRDGGTHMPPFLYETRVRDRAEAWMSSVN